MSQHRNPQHTLSTALACQLLKVFKYSRVIEESELRAGRVVVPKELMRGKHDDVAPVPRAFSFISPDNSMRGEVGFYETCAPRGHEVVFFLAEELID
jgi:hypothetical protein